MAFGKEVKVKAKPARTIVKAFPVAGRYENGFRQGGEGQGEASQDYCESIPCRGAQAAVQVSSASFQSFALALRLRRMPRGPFAVGILRSGLNGGRDVASWRSDVPA